MRLIIGVVAGWSLSLLVQASNFDTNKQVAASLRGERPTEIPMPPALKIQLPAYVGNFSTAALPQSGPLRESSTARVHESTLVRAISQAKAKGVIERGVEGYTEVLIKCQKKESVVHTTALLRSNAQRDHCFRF